MLKLHHMDAWSTSVYPSFSGTLAVEIQSSGLTQIYDCWASFSTHAQVPGLNVAVNVPQLMQTPQPLKIPLHISLIELACNHTGYEGKKLVINAMAHQNMQLQCKSKLHLQLQTSFTHLL